MARPAISTRDGFIIKDIPDEVSNEELKAFYDSIKNSGSPGEYSYGVPVVQGAQEPMQPVPKTTATGMLGGFTRGAGPTALAGAGGALAGAAIPGMDPLTGAAIGMTSMEASNMLTPYIAKFLNDKMGTEQKSMQEAMGELFDKLNVERPDTEAEVMAQAAGAGLSSAATSVLTGGLLQGGMDPSKLVSTVSNKIGQILAANPGAQLAGGALAGAGAEKGAQIAEEKEMGPIGSFLLPLGLGIAGDLFGTGLAGAAGKINKLITAKGMDLPDAAAEAIRLSQGRGEVFLSDLDPKTSGQEATRSFRETTAGGTADLRLKRNQVRRQNIYDTMDDFGVVEGDYYARDIVDDFLNERGNVLTKWKDAKDEVIDRLSHGGMDAPESGIAPEDAVDIANTLDLISNKRAELSALGDDSLQPLINTLTNWEGALDNKNLTQIEFLRKRLRNTFEDPGLAPIKKDGDRIAKDVYNSLNEEMGEYIRKEGTDADFNQWKTANTALADMMKDYEVGAIATLINDKGANPQLVNKILYSNDKEMAQKLYDGLSTQGRERARSAIMADMAKKSTDLGDLSPNQFARQIADQGDNHRVFFREEDGAQLEGLRKWLELTKRDEFSVGTAARPGSQLPGGQYALARGLWADPRIGIPVALAGKMGAGKFSQFLETGSARDLMIKLASIPDTEVSSMAETAKRLGEVYRAYMESTTPDSNQDTVTEE